MPSEPHLVEDLVFECLERLAEGGPAAVDELLLPHDAAIVRQVRETLATLRSVGLAGDNAPGSAPPDRFGPYCLLERIGSGAMGVVYRARRADAPVEPPLALKLMQPGLLLARLSRVRFEREIRALRHLEHPGICPILDDGEVDGVPFLVMPFVAGPSLRELLGAGPARDAAARDRLLGAMQQVAAALHHAHERGFVHRDVKPGNVVLRPDGQAVLLDFGLARLERAQVDGTLTASGGVVGTPAYMAPEQVAGRADVDRRCDVYALGAMLYEGLTGHLPHEAPTRESLYRRILGGDITPPSRRVAGLSAGVDAVCATALARDPARRYHTALLLGEDLARLRSGARPVARLPGAIVRTADWVRRHPLPSALLALLSLALLVVAVMAAKVYCVAREDAARLLAIDALRGAYSDPQRALVIALTAYESAPAAALVAMQTALAAEQPDHATPAFATAIAGVCFAAGGDRLFAHAEDGTGRLLGLPAGPTRRALVPDVELRDVTSATFVRTRSGDSLLVTGHRDGRITATRPMGGGTAWTVSDNGKADPVVAVHASPDGERVLGNSGRTVRVLTADGEVAASVDKDTIGEATWIGGERFAVAHSSPSGTLVSVWNMHGGEVELAHQRSWAQPIVLLRANPDPARCNLLLVVSRGREAEVWNLADDTHSPLRPREPFPHEITAADWSHDGALAFLAAAGGRTEVFDASGKPMPASHFLDDVSDGRAHPSQMQFALLGDQGWVTFVSFEGQTARSYARNRVRGDTLCFSRDGKLLATATWANEVVIRRLFDPDLPEFWDGGWVIGAQWDAGGRIVTAHDMIARNRGALRSRDLATGATAQAPYLLSGERILEFDLDAAAHGRALVVTYDGSRTRVRLLQRQGGTWQEAAQPPEGALRGYCLACQLAGDRALLVDQAGGIVLWNTTHGTWSQLPPAGTARLVNAKSSRWLALAATPDAATICAGGTSGYLHRFDRRADGGYDEAPPVWIGELVSSLRCMPDGSVMAGGVNGALVRVLRDGSRREFPRHGARVRSIAATPFDGEPLIASGDDTGAIHFWRLDGRLVREIQFDHGAVYSLAFSPDGERLLCGAGGSARIWPVRAERVVEMARARVH